MKFTHIVSGKQGNFFVGKLFCSNLRGIFACDYYLNAKFYKYSIIICRNDPRSRFEHNTVVNKNLASSGYWFLKENSSDEKIEPDKKINILFSI